MKKILAVLLSMAMVLGFTGCIEEKSDGTVFDIAFSAKDAIKIEDIDWNVTENVMAGERFVSFNYTNNSKYTLRLKWNSFRKAMLLRNSFRFLIN